MRSRWLLGVVVLCLVSAPSCFRCRHGTEQSVTVPRAPAPRPWPSRIDSDSDSDTEEGAAGGEAEMDFLRNFFSQTLGLGTQKERLLDELTLEGVSRYMQSERCRRVICLVGAGISTSAGIPDFRSPSTGLYANLEKYRLPYPEAIFEIGYFKKHPEPFFALAKELYPGQFKPTICHYFIRLLKEKGLLLRCYTQNIDTLERVAGLEPEDLVEAHGTFYTSHCISPLCRQEYTLGWMKEKIFSEVTPKCEKCQSVVKPGEPRGLGPPEVDLGWDSLAHEALPTPPASPQGRPHPCPGSAFCSCLCSGSLPVSVPPPHSPPPPTLPLSPSVSVSLCPSVSTSDIVFFGENLPARFFSCMQSVSVPATAPALVGQPGSCSVEGWAGARVAGSTAQPPWPRPFTGLPEGGPSHRHGHLPAGAALRIPHQQVGWGSGWGRALGTGGARAGPHSAHPTSPPQGAPLHPTPAHQQGEDRPGESFHSHPSPSFLGNQGTGPRGIPVLWTPRLRFWNPQGQVRGYPDSRIPQASGSLTSLSK
uniref:NAD-dependent protein deacetylase sirtuin-2 n=1 Tax=Sus scrofa TaxID=9823 RepID=A0A4X1T1L8_PIG